MAVINLPHSSFESAYVKNDGKMFKAGKNKYVINMKDKKSPWYRLRKKIKGRQFRVQAAVSENGIYWAPLRKTEFRSPIY